MRYSEIQLSEASGKKFNVYMEIKYPDKNLWAQYKKSFTANDDRGAANKANAELEKAYDKGLDISKVKGWEHIKDENDGSYMNPEYPFSIDYVKEITGPKKKGASPYNLSDSVRAYSSHIAEALHGRQQSEWFQSDLDGLAYDGNEAKEEALEAANRFAPIYFEGEDRYFVDAKTYNNDGDMGWIWTLAPKAEV